MVLITGRSSVGAHRVFISFQPAFLVYGQCFDGAEADLCRLHRLPESPVEGLALQRGVNTSAARVEPGASAGLPPLGIQDNLVALERESDDSVLFNLLATANTGPDRNHTTLPALLRGFLQRWPQ
ncbi:hypothetical protein [Nesterenkonia sedimenti]